MHKGAVIALEEAQRILDQTRQLLRDEEAAAYARFCSTLSSDPAGLLVNSWGWLEVRAFGRQLDAIQHLLWGADAKARNLKLPSGVSSSVLPDPAVPSDMPSHP